MVRTPRPSPEGGHSLRLKPILGRSLLVAASVVLTLAAVEIALRVLGPPPLPPDDTLRTYTTHDPELGWKGPPGAAGLYRTKGVTTHVALNSGGWRDDEDPPPPGRRSTGAPSSGGASETPAAEAPRPARALLLGDSFAWGYGVERGEMFADRVEAIVPGLVVINRGVPGYGTDQELLVLRRELRGSAPDVLVVEFAVENDVGTIVSPQAYRLPKPRFVLEGESLHLEGVPVPRVADWASDSRGSAAKRFLNERVRIYAWARPRWSRLRAAVGGSSGPQPAERRLDLVKTPPGEKIEKGWVLAEALLREMRDEARRVGARMVLLEVPDRLQVDEAYWASAVGSLGLDPSRYDREAPERRLRAIVARLGIDYVEMLGPLRAAGAQGRDLFLRDDIHWNAEGHRIAAEELARALAEPLRVPAGETARSAEVR